MAQTAHSCAPLSASRRPSATRGVMLSRQLQLPSRLMEAKRAGSWPTWNGTPTNSIRAFRQPADALMQDLMRREADGVFVEKPPCGNAIMWCNPPSTDSATMFRAAC